MRIQVLSQRSGISKRNIHFYIKENLLCPRTDAINGYYDFTENDYRKLIFIKSLRDMGVSISNIKALLDNPASAEYYLRMHLGRLKQELEILTLNANQVNDILDNLPVNPNFETLYDICTSLDSPQMKEIPLYDGKLVNHFLWRTFWQKEELTEYQQYLWEKINRLTNTRDKNIYYAKVYDYLCLQDQKKIHRLYQERNAHFNYVAELSERELSNYTEEMKLSIAKFIHTPLAVKQWKEHYASFLKPQMHIFTGEIGKLAKEMSPFFCAYQQNSSNACALVFEWLQSDAGQTLYKEIQNILDGFVDLDSFGHAELESMNTIFKY